MHMGQYYTISMYANICMHFAYKRQPYACKLHTHFCKAIYPHEQGHGKLYGKLQPTSEMLEATVTSSPSLASFNDNLKKAGVNMKYWRTKLWNHF